MSLKPKIGLIITTLIMVIIVVAIGPMDIFTHGFFYDEIDCNQIAPEDFLERVDLEESYYEVVFSPRKPHMVGFEIYLMNQPDDNNGRLHLTLINSNGKELEHIYVDLSKVHEAIWYKVYTSVNLKNGEEYILRFSAEDCETIPYLQTVDPSYLPDETINGNALLVYAYAEPTFTFQNKVIIVLFIFAIWGFVCSLFLEWKYNFYLRITAASLFMTAVLTWNYMYNSIDNLNNRFAGFQADSESLVAGMIYADRDGVYFKNTDEYGFGLGQYYNLKGWINSYGLQYITNNDWNNGYSRTQPAIVVNSNIFSRDAAVIGNRIVFNNGDNFEIVNIEDNGANIVIYLNSDSILTPAKYGSLDDITFYGQDNQKLDKSGILAYPSQYGLQGKVFKRLARFMEEDQAIVNLHLLCSVATSVVFVIIVMLIAAKYNRILAGCFFVTFWLSPWIVNFARNLYWVEYTWFIPMAVGLFCAWQINSRRYRIISYIGAFIAILGKCLCGYEYITVIMMSLIAFLTVDFVASAVNRDKEKARLLFRTIFIMGAIAVAGFVMAIIIHAPLKGDGSIIEGIKNIFEEDVLRRTNGADLNELAPVYWPSLNASVWETYCIYFHFGTEVITGITGNLFPILCVAPLLIFGYEFKNKEIDIGLVSMYVFFFLASISWFCLAKGHSYIHTGMNYVLWYFGFVQICIYVIVNKIIRAFRNKTCENNNGRCKY